MPGSITADRPDAGSSLAIGCRRKTMGQSAYDPSDDRPAWNTNRKFGAKRQLILKEISAIRFMLIRRVNCAIGRSLT